MAPAGDEEGKPEEDATAKAGRRPRRFERLSLETLSLLGQLKCFEVLPAGTAGRARPVRCLACTSKKQPGGKIFDLTLGTNKDARHFIRQHCKGPEHVGSFDEWIGSQQKPEKAADDDLPESNKPEEKEPYQPCTGFSLTHNGGRHAKFRAEIQLWAHFTDLKTPLAKHKYIWDLKTQELKVFHEKCPGVARPHRLMPDRQPVCNLCAEVDRAQNLLRNMIKFANKHWMARLLESRLFWSDEQQEELLGQFRETFLYKSAKSKYDEKLSISNEELQAEVRKSFSRFPPGYTSDMLRNFINRVVQPCLSVNVSDCNSELRELTCMFQAKLVSGKLSEFSELCARIAKATCEGKFSQRPAIMGLMLQCLESVDREGRGIRTMKGARKLTNAEHDLVNEAGSLLALNKCSEGMMRQFGFNRESCLRSHGKISNLHSIGLPSPPLAVLWHSISEQNAVLVDSLVGRPSNVHARRLNLAFDFTYLSKLHSVMELNNRKVVVGSPFCMKDIETVGDGYRSCLGDIPDDLTQEYKGEKQRANRMLLECSFGHFWTVSFSKSDVGLYKVDHVGCSSVFFQLGSSIKVDGTFYTIL